MNRTRALERLLNPDDGGKLGFVEFRLLMLQAGYSEADAQKAANERGWQRLMADQPLG